MGDEHCVTATVTDRFGNPTPGVTVVFSVTGAVVVEDGEAQLGTGGSVKTDGQGKAEFCYTSELPGENVIRAYADSDNSGTQDAGEPSDVATKTYVLPPSTPNCEITIHDGGWILAPSGGKGTFGGNAQVDANGQIVKGSQEYTDHSAGLHVKSTEILAVVCEGNSATIYGVANVTAQLPLASGTFPFRVRVTDMDEPGSQPGRTSTGYSSGTVTTPATSRSRAGTSRFDSARRNERRGGVTTPPRPCANRGQPRRAGRTATGPVHAGTRRTDRKLVASESPANHRNNRTHQHGLERSSWDF